MADRPDRPRRTEVPLPPMPAAWREPADPGEKPGPRPPSIRRPVSGPPVAPVPPLAVVQPVVQPPRPPQPARVAPPRFAAPPQQMPVFGPTVPPYAQQPLTAVTPVAPARPRPVSSIPYPGLPLSVPPMGMAPGTAPAEVHPETGEPLSDRSSLTAGLLQLFLGAFGAGRLYTGHVAMALFQMSTALFLFVFTMCAGAGLGEESIWALVWVSLAWPVIDGIVLLGWGGRDSNGHRLR